MLAFLCHNEESLTSKSPFAYNFKSASVTAHLAFSVSMMMRSPFCTRAIEPSWSQQPSARLRDFLAIIFRGVGPELDGIFGVLAGGLVG